MSSVETIKSDLAEYKTYDKDEGEKKGQIFPATSASENTKRLESIMETEPMMIDVQTNDTSFEEALVDTGNTCYITISEETARKLRLPTKKLARSRRVKESVMI